MQYIAGKESEKAKRIQKLEEGIDELREQVQKDLKCDDTKKCLLALAVALLDESAARMGNMESVEENDHYGISTLRRDHITFHNDGGATLTYTGKSGVHQERKINDSKLVSALKTLTKDRKGDDFIFQDREDENITRIDINKYLSDYDITAKDIRGYRANTLVRDKLKGKTGKPKDEREKIFKDILEEVADKLGHKPATLKENYLVPGLMDAYIEDDEILDKFDKKAMRIARRVARRKWASTF